MIKKNLKFLIPALFIFSCSSPGEQKPNLPEKISNLPVGLEITHSPTKVYARTNENHPEKGDKYEWKYKTTVKSLNEDLTIIEFGGFGLENGNWVERTIYERPFNTAEFIRWYDCPDGLVKKGNTYSDPDNWTSSNTLKTVTSKSLWYFIGINKEKIKFVGYSEVQLISELKKTLN